MALAVLDIKALVHVDEVSKLYSQVVAGHFVHLDPAFFYVIRTQANQNGVAPFFTTVIKIRLIFSL